MDTNFWLERWRRGEIGFHQQRVTPLLQKYWPRLTLHAGSRVLVPLAGKSLDVAWLAQQGHAVLAVELSPIAVHQFFETRGLTPTTRDALAKEPKFAARGLTRLDASAFRMTAR